MPDYPDNWRDADSAISEAAFAMRFNSADATKHFEALSDSALIIAVRLTFKLQLKAAAVLSARRGHSALLEALADD